MESLHTIAVLIFWFCIAGIIYAYAVYPAVLWVLARQFGSHTEPLHMLDADLPFVSLLIAAHNEAAVIQQRIENALNLDYPRDKLEIVIASDGSNDATAEISRRCADRNVRVLDYQMQRGKAAVLNSAMKETRGKIIVLSDANTFTDPGAVRALIRWFADGSVGAVCGRLILTDPHSGKNADGMYWRYETLLKRLESRLGALLGSNGAIYAIRAELFPEIPAGTIVEDFVIPLLARLQTGCRIVYDESAVAREQSAPDIRGEFRRRVRIGAGDWQAIAMLWPLLDPRQGWVAFTFFSHKVLRWLGPFFLLAAIVLNLLLLGSRLYADLGFAQLSGYAIALLGAAVPKGIPAWKPLRLANLFVSMNLALLFGFFRFIKGPGGGMWKPTQRLEEIDPASDAPSSDAALAAEIAE
jgi:cellulose synthase/poly-beta-1,6-N-acetylglucosamine synthase-like glycosyltransferase